MAQTPLLSVLLNPVANTAPTKARVVSHKTKPKAAVPEEVLARLRLYSSRGIEFTKENARTFCRIANGTAYDAIAELLMRGEIYIVRKEGKTCIYKTTKLT